MSKTRYTTIIKAILNDAGIVADPLVVEERVSAARSPFTVGDTRVGLFIDTCKYHGELVQVESEVEDMI